MLCVARLARSGGGQLDLGLSSALHPTFIDDPAVADNSER
jgi:hypothetical protein